MSNPNMGGLIMPSRSGNKRKNTDAYGNELPPKKFNFDGKWALERNEMREFVSTCNIYKTVRLLIPSKAAKDIEDSIQELEEGDDCKIIMPPSSTEERNMFIICNKEDQESDPSKEGGNYIEITDFDREVAENLANVITRIATIITPTVIKEKYSKDLLSTHCELRILIHNNLGGRIIGKGGDNIKRIRDETQCKITLHSDPCPKSTDICCQISGLDEQVYNACVEVILTQRSNCLARAQGTRLFYNADKAVNEGKYGQYSNQPPKPKGSSALAQQAGAAAMPSSGPKKEVPKDQRGPDCLFRFLIPENVGGRVIGKGGEVVDRVRVTHNALLKSPNSTTTDRVVYVYAHTNADNKEACVGTVGEVLAIVGDILKKKSVHMGRQLKRHNPRLGQTKFDITEINVLMNKGLVDNLVEKGELDRIWKKTGAQVRAYVVCCPGSTDRIVNISGSLQEIVDTVKEFVAHYGSGVYEKAGPDVKYYGVFDPNYRDGVNSYGGYITDYGGMERTLLQGVDFHGTPNYVRNDDESGRTMNSAAYEQTRVANYSSRGQGGSQWRPQENRDTRNSGGYGHDNRDNRGYNRDYSQAPPGGYGVPSRGPNDSYGSTSDYNSGHGNEGGHAGGWNQNKNSGGNGGGWNQNQTGGSETRQQSGPGGLFLS